MIATTLMGVLAVFFAYLARFKGIKFGLKISFFIIFVFLALRYNFGNDYKGYVYIYSEATRYKSLNYFNNAIHAEPGWLFLCRAFKPVGFFSMVMALALFNCIVYYRFIKKYIPVRYYYFAVFIYVFSPGYLLTHLSLMRQSLSVGLFVVSIDYLYKKNAIKYFICIGLAWLMHSSAIVLFPLYLLSFLNWKINKIILAVLLSIFTTLFIFLNSLVPFIDKFINSYFQQYENYQDPGTIGTGIGLAFLIILFIMIIYHEKFQNRETGLIFKFAIISFLFIPLSLYIQLIARIGHYFSVATIIVYPIIYMNLKNLIYKKSFMALIFLFTIYNYFQFFQAEVFKEAYSTYQTIFSAKKWF